MTNPSPDLKSVAPVSLCDPIETTDDARDYLEGFCHTHFKDRSFEYYIRTGLAGDFAWNLAHALAAIEASATSPDLPQPQVEAESVDTPQFQSLIDELCGAATDSWACGGDFGTSGKRGAAESALIAHIDSIITARVAAARQAGFREGSEKQTKVFCDHLAASQAAPAKAEGWISCAERLPELGVPVLIWFPEDPAEPYRIDMWDEMHEDPIGMGGATICTGVEWLCFGDHEITHWMSLPAPPSTPAKEPT